VFRRDSVVVQVMIIFRNLVLQTVPIVEQTKLFTCLIVVSGTFSDHMCLLRVFQAWQKARSDGWEKNFCQRNFMSQAAMEMIVG